MFLLCQKISLILCSGPQIKDFHPGPRRADCQTAPAVKDEEDGLDGGLREGGMGGREGGRGEGGGMDAWKDGWME
jgi:hypothetical protein